MQSSGTKKKQTSSGFSCNGLLSSVRNNRLDVGDCAQKVLNDLVALLVANSLDLLQFLVRVLVGVLLGLLVAAGVLLGMRQSWVAVGR